MRNGVGLARFMVCLVVLDGCLLGAEAALKQASFGETEKSASNVHRKFSRKSRPPLLSSRARSSLNGLGTLVDLKELIRPLLEVRCHSNDVTVLLHYERKYASMTKLFLDAVRNAALWAGVRSKNSSSNDVIGDSESTGRCEGRRVPSEGSVVLKFGLDECGIVAEFAGNNGSTVSYNTQITIKLWKGQNNLLSEEAYIRYPIQCIHPVQQESEQMTVRQSLKLFGSRDTANTPWTYPHSVSVDRKEVWLEPEATISWYSEKDMYSFPISCWTSPQFDPKNLLDFAEHSKESQPKKLYFVEEGCHVNTDDGEGRSSVHSILLGASRVRFELNSNLLFDVTGNPSSIFVNCRVIPCLQNYTKGLLNIPRCPKTRYCAGVPELSHVLPEYLRDVPTTTVFAGPLIVQTNKDIPDHPADVPCPNSCPPVIVEKEWGVRNEPMKGPTIVYHGVSLKITAVVAFCSLMVGMALMGALWILHSKTDPKKKLNNMRMSRAGMRAPTSLSAHPLTGSTNQSEGAESQPSPTARLMLNPL